MEKHVSMYKYFYIKKALAVSPTAATFYFYNFFWSVLGSQALETPRPCTTAPKPPRPARPSPESSLEPSRNLLRNPVEPDLPKPPRPSPELSPKPFSGTFSGTLLNLTCQSLPDLLRNFLRNPVEPDLALHQSLPDCFRILLRNLLRNPVELHLALHQGFLEPFSEPFSEPFPEPCWTWSRSAPKPPRPLRNLFRNLVDRRLHQCTPELFWAEDPISLRYLEQIHIGIYESEYITSSTAQGRGGSFKNRKPVGEVGCCESRMAEQSHWWIERCLISLTLSLSLSLSLCLSTYLSIYLSLSSV